MLQLNCAHTTPVSILRWTTVLHLWYHKKFALFNLWLCVVLIVSFHFVSCQRTMTVWSVDSLYKAESKWILSFYPLSCGRWSATMGGKGSQLVSNRRSRLRGGEGEEEEKVEEEDQGERGQLLCVRCNVLLLPPTCYPSTCPASHLSIAPNHESPTLI